MRFLLLNHDLLIAFSLISMLLILVLGYEPLSKQQNDVVNL